MIKKIRIGLLLNDEHLASVDLSQPELGNPGIGGTQFNFVTLPYYFNKFFTGQIEWVVIYYGNCKLPTGLSTFPIQNISELKSLFNSKRLDYFIWKPDGTNRIISLAEEEDQALIAWCHNIPAPDELTHLANSKVLKRAVFAGHEALDVVRDHPIILKSTVIWNGFDPDSYVPQKPVKKQENLVVFLGSLHPGKCFHLLAAAWPEIIRKNPEAKLVVIGSGALYDRSLQLGPHQLAESSYESLFMKYLVNEKDQIHPSVKFMGLLGREKNEILHKASVGVINPHGKSEVCPGSAIEFQACGTPVVAGARYGNLDVIQHRKTGFLVKNHTQLVNRILWLLDHSKEAEQLGKKGRAYINDKFGQKKIAREWKSLIEEINKDCRPKVFPMKRNWLYNFKIIFEIMRTIKFRLGLFKTFPSIYEIIEKIKEK